MDCSTTLKRRDKFYPSRVDPFLESFHSLFAFVNIVENHRKQGIKYLKMNYKFEKVKRLYCISGSISFIIREDHGIPCMPCSSRFRVILGEYRPLKHCPIILTPVSNSDYFVVSLQKADT